MKYFVSIMKYIALAILMANTCMLIYYLFYGNVLNIIASIFNELSIFISTYLFNLFADEEWNNE